MSLLNWGLVLLLSCLWGSCFIFAEVLLEELPPFLVAFLRVSVTLPVLVLFCVARRQRFPRDLPTLGSLAVMGVLNNVVPFTLIGYAQLTITGGLAAVLNSVTAFFSVVVAAILLRDEPLTANRLAGILVGIAGVVVVVGVQHVLQVSVADFGQVLMLCAGLSYALAAAWGKMRLKGLPEAVTATCMLAFSAAILGPMTLLAGDFGEFRLSTQIVVCVIGLSIFGTGGAYLLYFRILHSAGASNLMLATIIVPIVATALDALVLSQFLKAREIAGFFVILAGLVVLDGRLLRRLRGRGAGPAASPAVSPPGAGGPGRQPPGE